MISDMRWYLIWVFYYFLIVACMQTHDLKQEACTGRQCKQSVQEGQTHNEHAKESSQRSITCAGVAKLLVGNDDGMLGQQGYMIHVR